MKKTNTGLYQSLMKDRLNLIKQKIELNRNETDQEYADGLYSLLVDQFNDISALLEKRF